MAREVTHEIIEEKDEPFYTLRPLRGTPDRALVFVWGQHGNELMGHGVGNKIATLLKRFLVHGRNDNDLPDAANLQNLEVVMVPGFNTPGLANGSRCWEASLSKVGSNNPDPNRSWIRGAESYLYSGSIVEIPKELQRKRDSIIQVLDDLKRRSLNVSVVDVHGFSNGKGLEEIEAILFAKSENRILSSGVDIPDSKDTASVLGGPHHSGTLHNFASELGFKPFTLECNENLAPPRVQAAIIHFVRRMLESKIAA